jgi:hypothetical protein
MDNLLLQLFHAMWLSHELYRYTLHDTISIIVTSLLASLLTKYAIVSIERQQFDLEWYYMVTLHYLLKQ